MPKQAAVRFDAHRSRNAVMIAPSAEQQSIVAPTTQLTTVDRRRADKYGRDPRRASTELTHNTTKLAALEDATVEPAKHSKSAGIPILQTLDDFNVALDKANAAGKLMVVKFYAPWCMACKSIKTKYQAVAKLRAASADFYEVDYAAARVLCALAGVAGMPGAHIYDASGEFRVSLGLTGKGRFAAFITALEQAVADAGDQTGEELTE